MEGKRKKDGGGEVEEEKVNDSKKDIIAMKGFLWIRGVLVKAPGTVALGGTYAMYEKFYMNRAVMKWLQLDKKQKTRASRPMMRPWAYKAYSLP